ncbi:Hypothetical protein, putative [Bodo saltans]|uniref:Uncharacterized protein n=1 Tax=Bodo saltans TaxID=75058 RepID=A0A0S4JIE0_BODSA|nr:Hypothetical protein, putative [Bodo saltans]|eukprot:CUG89688.1 Hypothetical protein, putative [Bodo saltans]
MASYHVSPRRSANSTLQQSPIVRGDIHMASQLGDSHLTEIQLELELLKERRRALEQQRKMLLRGGGVAAEHNRYSSSRSHSGNSPQQAVQTSTRSSSARSNRSFNRSENNNSRSTSAMDQRQFIPSERERREHTVRDIYREMKEAMRKSWETDSTLVGGFFAQPDNPRNSTFGRERRFTPLSGTKGQYHLATDVEEMQKSAKERKGRHLTASSRGRPGCNVQSNWNDSKGGAAPGPGAYTPRYQKLSKPSILASRML